MKRTILLIIAATLLLGVTANAGPPTKFESVTCIDDHGWGGEYCTTTDYPNPYVQQGPPIAGFVWVNIDTWSQFLRFMRGVFNSPGKDDGNGTSTPPPEYYRVGVIAK